MSKLVLPDEGGGDPGSSTAAAQAARLTNLERQLRLMAQKVDQHFGGGHFQELQGPIIYDFDGDFTIDPSQLNSWDWLNVKVSGTITLCAPHEDAWKGYSNWGASETLYIEDDLGNTIAEIPPGSYAYIHTVPQVGTGIPIWPLSVPVYGTAGDQLDVRSLSGLLEPVLFAELLMQILKELKSANYKLLQMVGG